MIKITNITMKNFLSFGNVTSGLRLDQHGLTMLIGANSDVSGAVSKNGAGKSSITQAISFALFGKSMSKIKLPNLINNINNKGMLVTVEFERDGKKYRIERGKKPDVMRFYVNNQDVTSATDDAQGENRHTQEEIERVIGMSHNMFKNIVMMNTSAEPFLKMPVAQQRDIIEELLGVTQISHRAETLKKLIGMTKEGIRDQQATIKATQEANSRIQATIDNTTALSSRWNKDHLRTVREIEDQITALNAVDYDAELALFDEADAYNMTEKGISDSINVANKELDFVNKQIMSVERAISTLSGQLDASNDAQIKRLLSEVDRSERGRVKLVDKRTKFLAEAVSLQDNIDNPSDKICVCCGQDITGTDHQDKIMEGLRIQKADIEKQIVETDEDILEMDKHIIHAKDEIQSIYKAYEEKQAKLASDIAGHKDELLPLLTHKAEMTTELQRLQEDRKALPQKPVLTFDSRDELYKIKQLYEGLLKDIEHERSKTDPHSIHIDNLKSTLQVIDYDPMNELDTLFKHQDFLLRLLTSKDSFIRKKIIDQNLSYLNNRITHYLNKLGFLHEVKFMSDLSVEITLLGRDFDFEQLSRGEQNRVIMALSWSFRDVWESLNDNLNLVFVDEMLDQGTDSQGVEAALSVLKQMARERSKNVFLISHREELAARIDRTLTVKKENGFTTLEEE